MIILLSCKFFLSFFTPSHLYPRYFHFPPSLFIYPSLAIFISFPHYFSKKQNKLFLGFKASLSIASGGATGTQPPVRIINLLTFTEHNL